MCRQDPDITRTVPEIIENRGYPVKVYTVQTEDDYLIEVHRIPNEGGFPVLLGHSAFSSSFDWIHDDEEHSLGYALYNNGYDVWMLNSRGNTYSRKKLEADFWNFSFDEMTRDLSATIDFILNDTKFKKLHYIGFSQGNLLMFQLLASRSQYNDKIGMFIALSPVCFVGHARGIFKRNASAILRCYRQTLLASGHIPAGVSVTSLRHMAQRIVNNNFAFYDYGSPDANRKYYGQTKPPNYDLRKITAKMTLFVAENDCFATQEDVERLISELPQKQLTVHRILDRKWNHANYCYSTHTPDVINKPVLEILKQHTKPM